MGLPTFHSQGAGADPYPVTSTLNIPYPALISANDILLLFVFTRSGATLTTPSGWTQQSANNNGTSFGYLLTKTATGSETGSLTVALSGAGSGVYAGGIMASFSGASGVGSVATPSTNNNSTAIPPSETTTGANRLVVAVIEASAAVTVGTITGATGGTWSTPGTNYAGSAETFSIQTAALTSAGTISGGSATLGGPAAWTVFELALIGGSLVTKTLSTSSTSTATVTASKSNISRSLSATVTSLPALGRVPGRVISALVSVSGFSQFPFVLGPGGGVVTVTMEKIGSAAKVLTASASTVPLLQRTAGLTFSRSVSSSAIVSSLKPVGIPLTVAASVSAHPVMWFRRALRMIPAVITSLSSSPTQTIEFEMTPDEHA